MRTDYRRVAKVRYDGFVFDSKLERDVYQALTLEGLYGRLQNLRVKPKVHLTLAKILVIPDFVVSIGGKDVYIEAKGLRTSVWNLKMRLWKAYGPGEMRVYEGHGWGKGIYLAETIPGAPGDTVPTQNKVGK